MILEEENREELVEATESPATEAETPAEETPVEEPAAEVVEESEDGKKKKKPKSKARKIIEWVITIVFAGLFIFSGIGQIDAMIHKKDNFGQNLPYGYGSMIIRTNSMEPEYKVKSAIITHKISGDAILKRFTKSGVSTLVKEEGSVKTYIATWEDTDEARKNKHLDLTFAYVSCTYYEATNKTKYYNQTNTNPPAELYGYPMTHRLVELRVDENVKLGYGRYLFFTAGINPEGNQSNPGQYQAFTENEILGVVVLNSVVLGGFFGFISSPWGLLVFLLIPAFYLVITSVLDIFKAMKDPEEEAAKQASSGSSGVDSLDSLSKEDRERLKREMLEEMMNKKK